jgi:hypothetical protein
MGFINGLIGGYAGELEKKKDAEYEQEKETRKNRLQYVTAAIASGKLEPAAMDAALDEMDELTGGSKKGKGKGKGGFQARDAIKRLVGQFHDQMGEQPVPFEKRMKPQAPGADATGAAAPAGDTGGGTPPASLGEVPTRPGAAAPAAPAAGATPSEPPTRPGVFQTPAEEGQADFERNKPTLDYQAAQEEKKQKHLDTREDIKAKEAQEREDARQHALDLRQKNQQAFQLQMERLREGASMDRELKSQSFQMKLTDDKQAAAIDKETQTQRNTIYNGTLTSFRQQLAQASSLLKSREGEAQRQSWYQFWKDSPDVLGAKQDIENLQSTVNFLERNRADVSSGKVDMTDIVDQAEDILLNGVPATPDGVGHPTLPAGGQVTAPAWDLSRP